MTRAGQPDARVLDGRTARHAQQSTALVRDNHRQGGLAEPGWASQKDVIGGAILHRRSLQQKLELTAHLGLTDELGERAWPQGTLEASSASDSGVGRMIDSGSVTASSPPEDRRVRPGRAEVAPEPIHDRSQRH